MNIFFCRNYTVFVIWPFTPKFPTFFCKFYICFCEIFTLFCEFYSFLRKKIEFVKNVIFFGRPWVSCQCKIMCCFCLIVCLGFMFYSRIFHLYGDVTITGERLQILTMHGTQGQSSEGSLACHTSSDTGYPFIMVISEDP